MWGPSWGREMDSSSLFLSSPCPPAPACGLRWKPSELLTVGKRKQTSQEKNCDQNKTQDVEIRTGNLVATTLAKYEDEIPQIRRILKVDNMNVTIEWWIGRYSSTRNVRKTNGEPNTEKLSKKLQKHILKKITTYIRKTLKCIKTAMKILN